jgi:hypothetical protein
LPSGPIVSAVNWLPCVVGSETFSKATDVSTGVVLVPVVKVAVNGTNSAPPVSCRPLVTSKV